MKHRMKYKDFIRLGIEFLVVLLTTNYMCVTIICDDFFLLKYLRDIVLIILFFGCIMWRKKLPKMSFRNYSILIFLLFAFIGFLGAITPKLGFVIIRKYLFPLLLFYIISNLGAAINTERIFKFALIYFTLFAVWGIFQAHILGDDFLKMLGYPVEYSYAYKRDMLYNSYYFGGFGIQRVVATLSNSNVCGLILGTTLLFFLICYPYLPNIRGKNICLIIIGAAYLLTFSRSNFLAMMFVVLFVGWRYIPHKKKLIAAAIGLGVIVVIIGLIQGQDGIIYKLFIWVQKSLNFTESSAAGRSSRWLTALKAVKENPLGIGFGHVGSIADEAGIVVGYYSCENSYLAMALDTGWVGVCAYFLWVMNISLNIKKHVFKYRVENDKLAERLCAGAFSVIIYVAIVMCFSNHIYDMEAMAIIYIYIGIAIGVIKYYKTNE